MNGTFSKNCDQIASTPPFVYMFASLPHLHHSFSELCAKTMHQQINNAIIYYNSLFVKPPSSPACLSMCESMKK